MNIFTLLDQSARRFPDNGAVFLGSRQLLTFSGLRSRALKIAAALRRDFAPGVRIAVFSENRPEYIELFFGIWAAGMVVTPINGKLHPREVVQILEDSGARLLFCSPKQMQAMNEAVAGAGSKVCARLIEIASEGYLALMGAEMTGPVPSDPAALAWLFFTSGTTGRSKGAMLTHRNLMAMTIAHLADMDSADENTSLLHPAPMSHGSGLYVPAYIARGARQVVPESGGFDPAEFIALCNVHPGCAVFFAPTMVQRLRKSVEAGGARPANLATIIYGGGPMYLEEIRRSIEVFGGVFVQIYGLGESPMTITGLRRGDFAGRDEATLASVGYPRSGVQVAVVDEAGQPVPPGEVGEVICKSDVVMSGYWNNPKATADALRDGWLWTGDMGVLDDAGRLTLRDRSKDMIVSGGSNVYPREVEEVLLRHPGVEEVSVIGQPDDEWGEIVVAVVVADAARPPSESDLDALCNAHIARFKRPKKYVFRSDLPKSNYGKVLKRELRDLLKAPT